MKNRSPEGNSLTAVILEIFRLNGALLETGNKITKPHGLTSARWQVMGAIELAERPITVAQIARRMGLSRQGVRRIVKDLVNLGMVTSEFNVDHKRAPLIAISQKGEKTMLNVDRAQIAWVNLLSNGIEKENIDHSLELLQTIRKRCENNRN